MRSALVFSYFKWNQDYITANFCINRAVEKSTCNGNCRLKDMMQANEQNDQPQSVPIIPNLQVEEFYLSALGDLTTPSSDILGLDSPNFSYPFFLDRLSTNSLFQPPEHFLLFA